MKLRQIIAATLWFGLMVLAAPWQQAAQSHSDKGAPEKLAKYEDNSKARKYFTDVVLVNQDNEPMRFYSDLLKGKVVVINTFYTDCSGFCPIHMQKFVEIQKAFGDHVGQDVHLISISVDPANDTPPRLKEYAKRFNAKPGWYFLTGKKADVEMALYKVGQYVKERETHLNLIIIGNEPAKRWKKAIGLAPTESLIKLVEAVLHNE
jgi:protein SCO1/2